MKKIGIYFSQEKKMGYPFNKKEYLESYYNLVKDIEQNNDIEVYIVRGKSYKGNGVFDKSWIFDFNKEEIDLYESGKVVVDIIFNRDNENTIEYITDCKIINHPEFDNLCVDKLKTFFKFPDLSPKTAYINSYKEFLEKIKDFGFKNNDIIVLKKNFETEGNGIFVGKLEDIKKEFYNEWKDILLQEFIDSSVGIEGICDSLHDIRLNVVNGKITNSVLRTPKQGSYLANVAKGGSAQAIKLDLVPEKLKQKALDIFEGLKNYYPIVFSADFMNSKDGFRLVELNSRPGLLHPNWTDDYFNYNNALRDMLIESVK